MSILRNTVIAGLMVSPAMSTHAVTPVPSNELLFSELWRAWSSGTVGMQLGAGAEIAAYDPSTQRVFVTNAAKGTVDYFGAAGSGNITAFSQLDLSSVGTATSVTPNSVAVKNGIVAVAVEAADKQAAGEVKFFDAATGNALGYVTVGALPDMITFTPDGSKLLVANEGEPNDAYTVDPVGTVSIIDIRGGIGSATVATAGFSSFSVADMNRAGVRVFGPGASIAQDLEPEYIAVTPDGTKAFVTLQENNAVAIVDIATATVTGIQALGTKDHILGPNAFDASDKDGINGNFQNWPVKGMYMPDGIASYQVNGTTYYVTANEGDARDYAGYSEEIRIGDAAIDPALDALLTATLGSDWQADKKLGRLKTTMTADRDGDGDLDELLAYGARSFSIWREDGDLVWDSADALEHITLADGTFVDSRSDDKGPEPETVVIGEVNGKTYAFVAMERTSGVAVFNITDPNKPNFVSYLFSGVDIAPEGLDFVAAADSPTGTAMLITANEVSGTTAAYSVVPTPMPAAAMAHGYRRAGSADGSASSPRRPLAAEVPGAGRSGIP